MLYRTIRVAVPMLALLVLAACFLLPGKFASTLDVRRDGHFSFAYKGEIVVFSPDAMKGKPTPVRDDPAAPCFGAAPGLQPVPKLPPPVVTGPTSHVCSKAEQVARTANVARMNADAAERRKREGDQLAKMIGMDPGDEASMQAYAAILQKQAGWRSVVYRGKGVFDVDFAQSGVLDRDFIFPLLPRTNYIMPFVVIRKRADGAVLVSAPGFHANPMAAFANGFDGSLGGAPMVPGTTGPQGSLTITSDAAPLTNNTDDGRARDGDRSVLRWAVGPASDKIPEALLPLER